MRLDYVLTALLLSSAAAAEILLGRQDTTTASSSPSSSTAASENASNAASATITSSVQSSMVASGTTVSLSTAVSTTTQPSSTTVDAFASLGSVSLLPTAPAKPNALPLEPKITPAVGIAGILLLGLGAALCLVGIKHEWLHIFVSTALLGSLALTILIIYVMNPPVKDAVQGAYLVAIVITGLILGAISLIFKEVTEGLGCLLGGFCFAMWLSVLRPGGLVSSTASQAILIAVFCVAGFSLSFSRYTRSYGLIVLTSFAGAQVFVLGIDCYTRAGLKEFWIYNWDLNDDEFPLNTSTYPITRGIKVEIAGTVILFLFGVMSQLKLWKIIKARRAKRDEKRLEDEERRDQLDQAVGRNIEANNGRDRADWEAVYGDKDLGQVHVDSAVGSSISSDRKRSTSFREREIDAIEMSSVDGTPSKRGSKRKSESRVTVRVASDNDIVQTQPYPQSRENLLSRDQKPGTASTVSAEEYRETDYSSPASVADAHETTSVKHWSVHPSSATPGPAITPLPFSIPVEAPEQEDADQQSIGTSRMSVLERRGTPLKLIALKQKQDEDDKAGLPLIESDRPFSMIATADGDSDTGALTPRSLAPLSSYKPEQSQEILHRLSIQDEDSSSFVSPRRSFIEAPIEEDDLEIIVRPPTALHQSLPEITKSIPRPRQREQVHDSRRLSARGQSSIQAPVNARNVENLKEHLPEPMSKVAMVYRTNEWAKHAADASEPEPVNEPESSSPGVQIDPVFQQEAAKAAEEVQKPAPDMTPNLSRNASASSSNPYRRSLQTFSAMPLTRSNALATPVYAFNRSSSQLSLRRQENSKTVTAPKLVARNSRNFPAPLSGQALAESSIEEEPGASMTEDVIPNFPTATSRSAQSNLMDQRNDLLKRRPTTISFNALPAPDTSALATSAVLPVQPHGFEDLPEDEMTLAQRKTLMQLQRQPQQTGQQSRRNTIQPGTLPLRRSSSWQRPAQTGPTRINSTVSVKNPYDSIMHDSHQPKRQNTVDSVRQSNMLTQWRASLQQEYQHGRTAATDELARQQMIEGRRQTEYLEQKQQAEKSRRQSAADLAMRQGYFHEAHRDAMRRMQAKANRKADG